MLKGKKVIDIIAQGRDVVSAQESDTVFDVGKLMKEHKVGSLLVRNADDDITGIITEHDLVMKVVAIDKDTVRMRAMDVMTRDPIAIRANETIPKAMQLMSSKRIRHLPVVDDVEGRKEVVGMLSGRDILAAAFKKFRAQLQDTAIDEESPV